MPRKGAWKPPVYVGPPVEAREEIPKSKRNGAKCQTCFDLDLRYIPRPHNDPDSCTYGQVTRHWISSSNLAKDRSCPSCRLLKSAFDTLLESGNIINIPPRTEYVYWIAILDRNDDDSSDDDFKKRKRRAARLYLPSQGLIVIMRASFKRKGAKEDEGQREEFKVEIYTPPGAPAAPWKAIGESGEVARQPTAAECANIIRVWLDDCDRNHKICQAEWLGPNGEPELLPHRVLDLSNGQIRLVETTPGQRAHYVALSHCWGPKPLLTTTRETIAERMRGIPFEILPKTFQDAISLTKSLGLRYIWIDSFCIIQQDKTDWEQQGALMADIYGRCYLNIATTRASSGHEGCLAPRWTETDSLEWAARFAREVSRSPESDDESNKISKLRKNEMKSFKVPDIEQDIRIRIAIKSAHEALQTPRWIRQHIVGAPLLSRGWVHQERFLAARTVHMHANEMVWVCNTSQRCECRELDGSPVDGDGWGATKDKIVKLPQTTDLEAIHGLWRSVVEDFTLLDLKHEYESDRLPAIAGLATRFARYLPKNERYLAGLWEGSLARDLLWESGGSVSMNGPSRTRNRELAPSWSWASIVWGGDASSMRWEHETKPKLASWAGITTYHQDRRTRIISASVEIDGENKYGIVKQGCIVIEGAICAVVVKEPPRSSSSRCEIWSLFEKVLSTLCI